MRPHSYKQAVGVPDAAARVMSLLTKLANCMMVLTGVRVQRLYKCLPFGGCGLDGGVGTAAEGLAQLSIKLPVSLRQCHIPMAVDGVIDR